jgi:hypothetical protein
LYFFSGASDDFRIVDDAAAGSTDMLATGILGALVGVLSVVGQMGDCLSSLASSSQIDG